MTRTYHFRSALGFVLGIPVILICIYVLVCRFLAVTDLHWLKYLSCPDSGVVISCAHMSQVECFILKILAPILAIAALTYRKGIEFDGKARTMTTWRELLGMKFLRDRRALKSLLNVTLIRHVTTVRVKYFGNVKANLYILELVGKPTVEIDRFGSHRGRAQQIGREVAHLFLVPFIDSTKDRAAASAESAKSQPEPRMAVSRKDVEEVLSKWQRGQMTAAEVEQWSRDHRWSEDGCYDTCYIDVDMEKWEEGVAGSATDEALAFLKDAGEQLLTADDIPIFLKFLQSHPDSFESARDELLASLDEIDWQEREKKLAADPFYAPHCGKGGYDPFF